MALCHFLAFFQLLNHLTERADLWYVIILCRYVISTVLSSRIFKTGVPRTLFEKTSSPNIILLNFPGKLKLQPKNGSQGLLIWSQMRTLISVWFIYYSDYGEDVLDLLFTELFPFCRY